MQLVLASASEGRKNLLTLFKIPFVVLASSLDEDTITAKTPLATIQLRAKLKGDDVVRRIQDANFKLHHYFASKATLENLAPTSFLVLSADSGIIVGENVKELLGKPKDYDHAVQILKRLSHTTHQLITAIYIIILTADQQKKFIVKKVYQDIETSTITFKQLKEEDIKLYLSITNYTKYAGAYALFSSPQDFITKIEGSLSNVIGLPLEKIIPILRENNILPNPKV